MPKLSVKAWRQAMDAAVPWRAAWELGNQSHTIDPLIRLGGLFHVMHVAPYCQKYKRKFHPRDPGLADGTYWRERDGRSKYPDDPEWRDNILQVLRRVPAGASSAFQWEVPTYEGPVTSEMRRRTFLRDSDAWHFNYEGTLHRVEFDHLMPDELFLTPPADDDTYQLANICSWLPKLRSYLEQRTATISNEDGAGVLRRNDEAYSEGPREDRGEHGAEGCA